ncbi:hypothetical protein [Amycolatopsis sp. NPDC051903]|uniref:hypothetical protein n=1 Tax=Amycolatopsis sp. NPDC051903 TaxID=3363936 RepID=UPI00379ADDBC
MAVRHGRDDDEWGRLAQAGRGFLVERAAMRRTTSYTEFNAALVNRTGSRGFDFALDGERAAMGFLLERISEDAFAASGGLLISALVQYLDSNDAGPGFYALARAKNFAVPRSIGDRQLFWADHVGKLHEHYARSAS